MKLVEWIQNYLTEGASLADEKNNNMNEPVIGKLHLTPAAIKNFENDPFQLSMEMMRRGIECILQVRKFETCGSSKMKILWIQEEYKLSDEAQWV